MSRKRNSQKESIKSNLQDPTNSWIFLLKGEALEVSKQYVGTGTPNIVTLRHPNSGESALFLFSTSNESVQEILIFKEGERSWFLDESVKSDGKIHLSTPVDPIFLVLPYLQKYCVHQAKPLDQLLIDEEFPETQRLLKTSGLKYLNMISDRKGMEELNAYKYNEEKTLCWLKKKTENVAHILKIKKINLVEGSVSSKNDNDAYLRYAHGIVSEYLVDDLSSKLLEFLNLSVEPERLRNSKRKSEPESPCGTKKVRVEETTPTSTILNSSTTEIMSSKTTIRSAKDKARAKAAVGSKSIGLFFNKINSSKPHG
ncbi:hypothetical protein JTB14_036060 [Gonioctena quinquepunctata]|nr:hypothetical protein JTB14_036060 [Gonioctena quinquepunctata]